MNSKDDLAKTYNKLAYEYTKSHAYGVNLSVKSLESFVNYLPKKAKILDVGCGGGQDVYYFSNQGYDAHGIDISKNMILIAQEHYPSLRFSVNDVFDLKEHEFYDGIWCSRVFHHVSLNVQDDFIKRLLHLLKPKGFLYITCAVSDKKDYEKYDSGNGSLLKKRLSEKSFKKLFILNNCKILNFKYWENKVGMELIVKKP